MADAICWWIELTGRSAAICTSTSSLATTDDAELAWMIAPRPLLIGFAAETGSLERAADKLVRKGVDLIVANDVSEAGSGFGTDTNRVQTLSTDGTRPDPPLPTKRRDPERVWARMPGPPDHVDPTARPTATLQRYRAIPMSRQRGKLLGGGHARLTVAVSLHPLSHVADPQVATDI